MLFRLIALTIIAVALLQIPSCHYYVSAVPRIIVSSEPFTPPDPLTTRATLGPD